MKKILYCGLGLLLLGVPPLTAQENSVNAAGYSKVAIGGELLGLGILASAFASYRPADMFAINVQAGYISGSASASSGSSTASVSYNLFLLPVTGSLLLGGLNHKFELLAGADFALGSASASASGSSATVAGGGAIPVVGGGYRYQPYDGGFFFRTTLYFLISTTSGVDSVGYFGLTLGYAFAG